MGSTQSRTRSVRKRSLRGVEVELSSAPCQASGLAFEHRAAPLHTRDAPRVHLCPPASGAGQLDEAHNCVSFSQALGHAPRPPRGCHSGQSLVMGHPPATGKLTVTGHASCGPAERAARVPLSHGPFATAPSPPLALANRARTSGTRAARLAPSPAGMWCYEMSRPHGAWSGHVMQHK